MAVAAPLPLRLSPALLRRFSDDRLVAQIRAGSEAAFETLYDRHAAGILGFARHMLGSREEAEDVVQHTFAAAYRALLHDDRAVQVRPWLYAVARNRCLDLLRARRDSVGLDGVEPATEGLAKQVQRRADLRALLGDLGRLPEDQRAALVLAELGAHTHDEIGAILSVRREKVKALVFQAREALESSRRARDVDCREIRQQLSLLRGGALRRTTLRRHLQECPGCRAFRAEVRSQRAAMAILLPVAPTVGLKSAVLGSALGGGSGVGDGSGLATGGDGGSIGGDGDGLLGPAVVAGAGGVATAGLSAGSLSSGSMLTAAGVNSVAAKALVIAAVAGGAGGGGYAAVDKLSGDAQPIAATREAGSPLLAPGPGPASGGTFAPATDRAAAPASKASKASSRGSASHRKGAGRSRRAGRRASGGGGGGGTQAVAATAAVAQAPTGQRGDGPSARRSGGSGSRAAGRAKRDTARSDGRARRDTARSEGRARRDAARAGARARRAEVRSRQAPAPAAGDQAATPVDERLDEARVRADEKRDDARAKRE